MPVALGLGVVFHTSPLEARAIGALVSRYAVTFLLATPTFLQGYIRRCSAEDFGSLKYVMTGAEKLPERIAVAFEDQFGIRPMEGYGCTECSPVVAVNTRDFRSASFGRWAPNGARSVIRCRASACGSSIRRPAPCPWGRPDCCSCADPT